MNEDVRAGVLLDETPALLVVEPLYLTTCHISPTSRRHTNGLPARRWRPGCDQGPEQGDAAEIFVSLLFGFPITREPGPSGRQGRRPQRRRSSREKRYSRLRRATFSQCHACHPRRRCEAFDAAAGKPRNGLRTSRSERAAKVPKNRRC